MHALSFGATAALVATASVTAQIPLAGYWMFDETSGLIAGDVGPYGNHGTLIGYGANGTWTTGIFGNALSFDGVDDYVDIAQNGGIPIYAGDGSPFSVCFWVNAQPTDDDRVYSEGQSNFGTNGGPLFTLGSGRTSSGNTDKLQVYIRNSGPTELVKAYTTTTVFDNTWHHVAYVDVAGDARVYVDGVLDPTSFDYRVSGPGGSANSGTQTSGYGTFGMNRVSLGAVLRANVVAYMTGAIDDLRIFGYALSAADVVTVMNNGFPGACRASLGEFGVGCGAGPFDLAATGSAVLGSSVQLAMQRGPANAPSFLCVGFGRIAPLDLGSIGFTGCTAYLAGMFCVGAGALDASGNGVPITVSIPNDPNLACKQVNFQAAALDVGAPTMVFSDVVQAYCGN